MARLSKTPKPRQASSKRSQSATQKPSPIAPDKPVLLVTIVNREKSEYFLDVIQSFHCNFQFSSFAVGTAQRALGLLTPDVEKAVLFSVVTKENVPKALSTLEEKFATIRGGGVAFTVPISGTVGVLIYRFLCNKG